MCERWIDNGWQNVIVEEDDDCDDDDWISTMMYLDGTETAVCIGWVCEKYAAVCVHIYLISPLLLIRSFRCWCLCLHVKIKEKEALVESDGGIVELSLPTNKQLEMNEVELINSDLTETEKANSIIYITVEGTPSAFTMRSVTFSST